ncbi:MAG: 2-hydroxyacid dehydrogenase [Microbacteriaceae bacterium]|nr:2-hydroxyacid dehydrogenase [Microbacteriaceae bacterium]
MSKLTVSLPNNEELRAAIGEVEGVEFLTWDLDSPAPSQQIDLLLPPYFCPVDRLERIADVDVQLIQWLSIGYDGVADNLPKDVPVANGASVHETSTAELTVGLAIAAQRGMAGFVRAADKGNWEPQKFESLADRRVLLIGYGGVSKAIEARLQPFEVEITRLARTARTEKNLAGESVEVRGFSDLHAALAEAEIVILAVPLTDETKQMIDAEALAALPDGALLINVARGGVVDTEALIAELESGRLRAALDVTDPEPLPEGHPLWNCPNLLLTPHVAGNSTAMLPRLVALTKRQIEHLKAGETPENIVLGSWE